MKVDLSGVRIVLVEPRGAFNIGSTARVMRNMGLSDLALVNPVEFRNDDGYRGAVGAKALLNGAREYASIMDAVKDTNLVAGTTRRAGKHRRIHCSAADFPRRVFPVLRGGKVSILFGREDSGLTTEETDLCNLLVSIPASRSDPSLNLSHAVAIVCYELFTGAGGGEFAPPARLALNGELEGLLEYIRISFGEMGFFTKGPPGYVIPLLRKVFGRALLDETELTGLSHIFHRLHGLFLDRGKDDS